MIHPLADEFLLISGEHSFLLAAKVNARLVSGFETMDTKYSQTVDPEDLVVVSAPEGGSLEPAIMLAEFVRTYRMPLIGTSEKPSRFPAFLLSRVRLAGDRYQLLYPLGNSSRAAPDLFQ